MTWRADTHQRELGPGTLLSVYRDPGLPVNPLRPDDSRSLIVRFSKGAEATVKVIKVTADQAIIEMSNRDRWRMTPAAPQERALAVDTGGAPTTYWVVRQRAKNIILLSDGTGNSAAKLHKTNVWRVYRALDLTLMISSPNMTTASERPRSARWH